MNKGIASPFAFVMLFVVLFVGASFIMAGTGWTGFSEESEFTTASCNDAASCTAQIFSNMVKLFTFNSQYEIFNTMLLIFYILLPFAVISIIMGGS